MNLTEVLSTTLGFNECENQIRLLLEGLQYQNKKAFEFFDTWGIQSGTYHYGSLNEGLLNECEAFAHNEVKGKYCKTGIGVRNIIRQGQDEGFLYDLVKKYDYKPFYACMPRKCSSQELLMVGNRILENISPFKLTHIDCFERPTYNFYDYLMIFFMVALLMMTIFASCYEIFMKKMGKEPNKLITAFSVPKNLGTLMKITQSSSRVGATDAIKVLANLVIISNHRRTTPMSLNIKLIPVWARFFYAIFNVTHFAVQAFVSCSGILVTMSVLRLYDSGKFNILKLYVGRYLRYHGALLFLNLFFMTNLSLMMVEGTDYHNVLFFVEGCKKYWWKSLLFIQNGINHDMCLPHTWYLSLDIQLFLMAPIVALLFWRYGHKTFKFFIPALILLKCWTTYRVNTANINISPELYQYTEFRIGEYMVGVAVGYIMYTCKGRKIKINPILEAMGWILSLGFIVKHVYDGDNHDTVYREVWSMAICWVIFATHTLQSGGILKNLLNHPYWQPFSRMSLSVYLIHYQYIQLSNDNKKVFPVYSPIWQFHIYAGDIFAGFFYGGIYHVVTVMPTEHLIGYLMEKSEKLPRKLSEIYENLTVKTQKA